MTDTVLNTFTNQVASHISDYLNTIIFPSIVKGLSVDGHTTTVDKLHTYTNVPLSKPTAPVSMPPAAFPGAVPAMVPAASTSKTRSKVNPVIDKPVPGVTCNYNYTRGKDKGKWCGREIAPGQQYCGPCIKAHPKLVSAAIPGVAPGAGAIPGVGPLPKGYGGAASDQSSPGLTVSVFDEPRGLYKDKIYGFIVTTTTDGIVVLGKHDESKNQIIALTESEKISAQNLGLKFPDTKSSSPSPSPMPVTVPEIPTAIPAIPTAIPAIPTAVPQMVSPVPGIPIIPTVN